MPLSVQKIDRTLRCLKYNFVGVLTMKKLEKMNSYYYYYSEKRQSTYYGYYNNK